MPDTLRVGLERAPITPPIGIQQIGYYGRDHGSESLLDDLYAMAMVFDDGETKLALVTCDLLFMHAETVARIRQEVASRTDIPASHVMIACTHTHSGPITYATEQQSERDRAYLTNLAHVIAGAICSADAQRQAACMGVGRGQAHIGINRREQRPDGVVILGENPQGIVDPEVLVWRIDSAEGYPLLALVNYACHAVALGPGNYCLSADWPGAMRIEVGLAIGAACAFIQGACADINPLKGPQRDYGWVQRLGQRMAGAVIQAWASVDEMADRVSLAAASTELSLPLIGDAPSPQELVRTKLGLSWEAFALELDQRFPWAADVREGDGVWRVPAEVQAFRLGDVGLGAVPAEPFVEVGLGVKKHSPLAATCFAGYANGCIGYLPMPAAYETGGYEVDTSYLYYHLPAPLAPQCAGMVQDAAVEMLNELAGA